MGHTHITPGAASHSGYAPDAPHLNRLGGTIGVAVALLLVVALLVATSATPASDTDETRLRSAPPASAEILSSMHSGSEGT